jgi:predicted N-formylglutamate amidohydrolase
MSRAFSVRHGRPGSGIVFTCEHASCAVPEGYEGLGVSASRLRDHIAWDIGAADLTKALADAFAAPAVRSSVSRLVVDCNRDLDDHDLIVEESDGVKVPGNVGLTAEERQRRVQEYYDPYHAAVDDVLAEHPEAVLLSVHSFTPTLGGQERLFDAGVLFDDHHDEAERFGKALQRAGFEVRYNQPYSGFDGLIFSARAHGLRHDRRYLELEINNGLLRTTTGVREVSTRVCSALGRLLRSDGR